MIFSLDSWSALFRILVVGGVDSCVTSHEAKPAEDLPRHINEEANALIEAHLFDHAKCVQFCFDPPLNVWLRRSNGVFLNFY